MYIARGQTYWAKCWREIGRGRDRNSKGENGRSLIPRRQGVPDREARSYPSL
jgi:hypothetical protein